VIKASKSRSKIQTKGKGILEQIEDSLSKPTDPTINDIKREVRNQIFDSMKEIHKRISNRFKKLLGKIDSAKKVR
jgi:hypothetical protein